MGSAGRQGLRLVLPNVVLRQGWLNVNRSFNLRSLPFVEVSIPLHGHVSCVVHADGESNDHSNLENDAEDGHEDLNAINNVEGRTGQPPETFDDAQHQTDTDYQKLHRHGAVILDLPVLHDAHQVEGDNHLRMAVSTSMNSIEEQQAKRHSPSIIESSIMYRFRTWYCRIGAHSPQSIIYPCFCCCFSCSSFRNSITCLRAVCRFRNGSKDTKFQKASREFFLWSQNCLISELQICFWPLPCLGRYLILTQKVTFYDLISL